MELKVKGFGKTVNFAKNMPVDFDASGHKCIPYICHIPCDGRLNEDVITEEPSRVVGLPAVRTIHVLMAVISVEAWANGKYYSNFEFHNEITVTV